VGYIETREGEIVDVISVKKDYHYSVCSIITYERRCGSSKAEEKKKANLKNLQPQDRIPR
jgi:hypothetical protein